MESFWKSEHGMLKKDSVDSNVPKKDESTGIKFM